jgi:hypothetical protein
MNESTETIMQGIAVVSQKLDMLVSSFEYDLSNEVSALEERLSLKLERAMATLFMDTSPLQLASDLKWTRLPGYEFFGVYAEEWKDDPAIAEAEQKLFELVAKPILVADSARNRAELEGWRDMSSLYIDGTPIDRDNLLDRAQTVLACDNGEISPEPTERIWVAMAKSARYRDELRSKHLPKKLEAVSKPKRPAASKPTAKKKAGPETGGPKPAASRNTTGPGRSARSAYKVPRSTKKG